MNHQYFEAVRLERTVMFFLLFFIVVVAAFGIMNTLITVKQMIGREPNFSGAWSRKRSSLKDS